MMRIDRQPIDTTALYERLLAELLHASCLAVVTSRAHAHQAIEARERIAACIDSDDMIYRIGDDRAANLGANLAHWRMLKLDLAKSRPLDRVIRPLRHSYCVRVV
jgi:hypothetical protein